MGVFVGDPGVRHRTGAGMSRLPQSAVPRKDDRISLAFGFLLCLIYSIFPIYLLGNIKIGE